MYKKYLLSLVLVSMLITVVSAYTMPLDIPTIWDTVVDGIFGSFWVAVLAIALVYFIILALGGVHLYTNGVFLLTFLAAMSLGYYSPFITFFLYLGAITFAVYSGYKYWSGL